MTLTKMTYFAKVSSKIENDKNEFDKNDFDKNDFDKNDKMTTIQKSGSPLVE